MDYKPSKFMDGFCDSVMDAKEWEAYRILYKKFLKEENQSGHFTALITGEKRTLKIGFYMSKKLDALFGLVGYISRPGEPKKSTADALKEQIELIEELEESP
jgi:hypothetical protein